MYTHPVMVLEILLHAQKIFAYLAYGGGTFANISRALTMRKQLVTTIVGILTIKTNMYLG